MIIKSKEVECPCCHKKVKDYEIKKTPSGFKCSSCVKEIREKRRDFLIHEVAGVRRRSNLKVEWEEKRRLKELQPVIKGSKISTKGKKKNPQISFYITKDEKYILWKKFNNKKLYNLSPEQIDLRINGICNEMKELVIKLKKKNKSEQEINTRFKEEFAKLLETEDKNEGTELD